MSSSKTPRTDERLVQADRSDRYPAAVREVLVIENDQLTAGSGWVGRLLDEQHVPWRLVRAYADELAAVDPRSIAAVVPLGGTPHVWDLDRWPYLRDEITLLRQAIRDDVPVLGCCLGGQLITAALDAEVRPATTGEYGWNVIAPTGAAADDDLFRLLERPESVYHWHLDEMTLPDGATLLATTAEAPIQAYRVRNAWALQFHPEVDEPTARFWFSNFPGAAAGVGLDEDEVIAEAERREPLRTSFAYRLVEAFVELVR